MHGPNLRILDLHGLTWAEAEASFIEFYNQTVRQADKDAVRLDVVHGYGSTGTGGVLLTRLRGFLGRTVGAERIISSWLTQSKHPVVRGAWQ